MRRQAGFPGNRGWLCFVALTGLWAISANAAHPGPVAPPAGPPLAPRTHGFMLYLSQPIGGPGAGVRPRFGLRLEQVRMTGNSGAPDAGDPFQRRTLIGWQIDGRRGLQASDMKLELGGRVTYDVSHGGFGIQSGRSGAAPAPHAHPMAVALSSHTTAVSTGVAEPKSFELHGLDFREVAAAAIASFRCTACNFPASGMPGSRSDPLHAAALRADQKR